MSNATVKINDTVRTKTGKVDYVVKSIDVDGVAKLEGVEKGTKRSADVNTLVVVKSFEAVIVPSAVEKVSFIKRAVKRVKGKRGGKLRNV